MADSLSYDAIKTAQTQPGFDLATAANAATLPINSTTLAPTQPATVPTASPNTSNSLAANLDTTQKSLQDYINQATPLPTELDTKYSSILDSIASLTGSDTGKDAYKIAQENANGLPDLQKQQADLNSQILGGLAELKKMQSDYQQSNNALQSSPQQVAAVVGSPGGTGSTTTGLAGDVYSLQIT